MVEIVGKFAGLDKPKARVVTLESLMNFKRGTQVKFNPDNHGFIREQFFHNQKDEVFEALTVSERGMIRVFCETQGERGGNERVYHYSNLKVIE